MDDVLSFFRETQEAFTVYVVEQRFVVGRGLDYFKSFKGKSNFIDSNKSIIKHINRVVHWIQKNIPSISELIKTSVSLSSSLGLVEAITVLNQLFSVHSHQAAGPEVIDPIIIQEGHIETKYITQIIALHEKSILQPVIILLLKDNDFDRAKCLLSKCPHGINIKFIRNSGQCEITKIINTGAENIDAFLDSFARQCFSTCSHTPRGIILNQSWAEDKFVEAYTPILLKIRSSLILDEKKDVHDELKTLINNLQQDKGPNSTNATTLLRFFECIARLMMVFCNDAGNQDIRIAYKIAKDINNPLLLAQVYRYAYFLSDCKREKQIHLLQDAEDIFSKYGMEDQSLYCMNNRLTYQFEQERIFTRDFKRMQEQAVHNVPGLVGMSHILNNVGVAYLMTGSPEDALGFFKNGLEYARGQERNVQRLALTCNMLIARSYCFDAIKETELRNILNRIRDSMGMGQLPFIAARFAMNVISIAFHENQSLGKNLIYEYNIAQLVETAFRTNLMGSGTLIMQMQYLAGHYPNDFDLLETIHTPAAPEPVFGCHREYIIHNGYNPFVFCTWL